MNKKSVISHSPSRSAQTMDREYHKSHSSRLGREMEMLIFGHAGLPVVAFPTSGGRFFELEDHGMIAALAGKIDAGELQIFCVDSVDAESWYNRAVLPRHRIARHQLYEQYLIHEALPLLRTRNADARLLSLGCSFGGYHAVNIALRHPELFTGCVSLSGAFNLTNFLDGYYDEDCYFHLPTHYLPNLSDPWFLDRIRRASYVLATGLDDHCLAQNRELDRILNEKEIPHRFQIWDEKNSHDWPAWQRMAREYL
jgi:esterase/lipase superfamily enzyme